MPQSNAAGWNLQHSYSELPAAFHREVAPCPVAEPSLVIFNHALAAELGLEGAELEQQPELFAGNALPPGAKPLAQAYAGHQYGHFTMLGDGRALLLGEQITPNGQRFDIQLKGPGPTPFSRRGDGRAALGPMLREYIISEAMHALGVPTTRSLAVVATGEKVYRTEVLPGAVLTRVAASHIRVGTFEYAAARQDKELLAALAEHLRKRHYPEVQANDAQALFRAAMRRQARLIAQWQSIGFVHGVMNTDNMALSGETIDYGPCAFMESYDPATVFSSIDRNGRYAYGRQPQIAQWNLARLAEALLPLFAEDQKQAVELANEAINDFPALYHEQWLQCFRLKLGLQTEAAGDTQLIEDLLGWMQLTSADFTQSFAQLARGDYPTELRFQHWRSQWEERLLSEGTTKETAQATMQQHSPAIIPRNAAVEAALDAASKRGDLLPTLELLKHIQQPFDHQMQRPESLTQPGCDDSYCTYCGT
jgi:serine/tyrosine/threonine adenylyltransferase